MLRHYDSQRQARAEYFEILAAAASEQHSHERERGKKATKKLSKPSLAVANIQFRRKEGTHGVRWPMGPLLGQLYSLVQRASGLCFLFLGGRIAMRRGARSYIRPGAREVAA